MQSMDTLVIGARKEEYLSDDEDIEAEEGSLGTRHRWHNQVIHGAPRSI
jgi:hypothetical protein